jgi:hypothetical protein
MIASWADLMPSPSTAELSIATRLLVIAAMFLLLRTFRGSPIFYALLYWPATIAHELTHLFVGFILAAKPVGFSVMPRRPKGSNYLVLGEVSFLRLRWWNKLPVGTAPLLLIPVGGWLVLQSLPSPFLSSTTLLFLFGALQCFAGAWPSPTDWQHAWVTVYVLAGLAAVAALLYWVLTC